ncbi:MAG: hypothetical protein AAGN35_27740 [Bacteroidota bacterium]
MKKLYFATVFTLSLWVLVSCNDSKVDRYIAQFPELVRDTIRFPAKKFAPEIESPFDGKAVLPFGKYTLHEDTVITLACYHDGTDPLGEIYAEFIAHGERKNTILIAMGDMDGLARGYVNLPKIQVEEHIAGDETGGYEMFTTYRVTPDGFEQIGYYDTRSYKKARMDAYFESKMDSD